MVEKSDRMWYTGDGNGKPLQIPYDYTADVRNRLKGLDLIDRVPEEL